MNMHAIKAIYFFEMARTFRTLLQSIISPVISTALYFIVFGSAIGSRMVAIDGVSYGAFIVPGLIMLTVLMQSVTNASFGIYFPKFIGTIYEPLSAPISYLEMLIGLCWGGRHKINGDRADYSGDVFFVCAVTDSTSCLDDRVSGADLYFFQPAWLYNWYLCA